MVLARICAVKMEKSLQLSDMLIFAAIYVAGTGIELVTSGL